MLAIGALLIGGKHLGAPDHHHGVMLGAAAGVLFGVSDVAIKAPHRRRRPVGVAHLAVAGRHRPRLGHRLLRLGPRPAGRRGRPGHRRHLHRRQRLLHPRRHHRLRRPDARRHRRHRRPGLRLRARRRRRARHAAAGPRGRGARAARALARFADHAGDGLGVVPRRHMAATVERHVARLRQPALRSRRLPRVDEETVARAPGHRGRDHRRPDVPLRHGAQQGPEPRAVGAAVHPQRRVVLRDPPGPRRDVREQWPRATGRCS